MKQFFYRLLTLTQFGEQERMKIISIGLSFFFVIGGYTIIKEIKDALFVSMVGSAYLGKVKLISMLLLIPATLLYAKLVDKMDRLSLLISYSLVYGIGGIVIAMVLAHPTLGLHNATPSPDRMLGWFIYLFYEGAMPFVVSVCWAYANSVTEPSTARKGYPLLVASSKVGGMCTALLGYFLCAHQGLGALLPLDTIAIYQLLLVAGSLMLCLAPYFLYVLTQKIGVDKLYGYKAAHVYEESHKQETGIFSGLFMILKNPYILGIFGMIFLYESVNVMLGYLRLIVLSDAAESLSELTENMFLQRFWFHFIGFCISFLGVRILLQKLGERICLLLIPITIGALLTYLMLAYDAQAVIIVFTVLQSLNYAFSPLRESLYIPTVKDIRFKSKAWIDSFGSRSAKAFSATVFDVLARFIPGSPLFMAGSAGFFALVLFFWLIDAWYLGKTYKKAIDNNEVIGA